MRLWFLIIAFCFSSIILNGQETDGYWIPSDVEFMRYSDISGWTKQEITAMYYDGDTLFVLGGFSHAITGTDTVAAITFAWSTDLTKWQTFNPAEPEAVGDDIIEFQGKLYYAGAFLPKFWPDKSSVAVFNTMDNQWDKVGDSNLIDTGRDIDMEIFQNKLFIVGDFGGQPSFFGENLACWNGSDWEYVGLLEDPGNISWVSSVTTGWMNGKEYLFAAGDFNYAGDYPNGDYVQGVWNLAKYDGQLWDSVADVSGAYVTAIYYDSVMGHLYISGDFVAVDGVPAYTIAQWDGSTWHSLGSGIDCEAYAKGLMTYHGELYAGGCLSNAGGKEVGGIARWDGKRWDAMDGGLKTIFLGTTYGPAIYDLEFFKDTLLVGGSFTHFANGSDSSIGLAKWYTPPCAYLEAEIAIDSSNGTQYYFKDNSAGLWKSEWHWDFGDGTTDTVQHPEHQYAFQDNYEVRLIVSHDNCTDTAYYQVNMVPDGIEPIAPSQIIRCYPNPANGQFVIESDQPFASNTMLQIHNANGQLIQQYILPVLQSRFSLSTSQFAAGIYICNVVQNERVLLTEKLVVE